MINRKVKVSNPHSFVFLAESHQRLSQAIATQERLKHTLDLELQALRQRILQHQNEVLPVQYHLLLPITVHTPGTLQLDIVEKVHHYALSYELTE